MKLPDWPRVINVNSDKIPPTSYDIRIGRLPCEYCAFTIARSVMA